MKEIDYKEINGRLNCLELMVTQTLALVLSWADPDPKKTVSRLKLEMHSRLDRMDLETGKWAWTQFETLSEVALQTALQHQRFQKE